ncbi:MAG TPA: hypothetical protein DCS93_00180 [Microscillaceae bacterium]|nr:hypothetical protein [Microscillaceae bacterium]
MEKPQVMYIFDPLCGWCYGFSPVIKKLKDEFQEVFDFKVYTGGMVLGDRIGTIAEKFKFLQDGAVENVEKTTGVQFGEAFKTNMLEKGDYIVNSEPPSIAFTSLRALAPNQDIELAHDIQNALYRDGKSFNEIDTYLELADQYNIAREDFQQVYENPEARQRTYAEFQMIQQLGINGYPTVVAIIGEQGYMLSRGFQPYEQLSATLKKIQEEKLGVSS